MNKRYYSFLTLSAIIATTVLFGFFTVVQAQTSGTANTGTPGSGTLLVDTNYGQAKSPTADRSVRSVMLNDLPSIFKYILSLINSYIIPIIIGLAVVAFLWGVLQLIGAGDDEGKRKEAKDIIIYGIVGLFVMVSVWGLVNILVGTLGFNFALPSLPPQQ